MKVCERLLGLTKSKNSGNEDRCVELVRLVSWSQGDTIQQELDDQPEGLAFSLSESGMVLRDPGPGGY